MVLCFLPKTKKATVILSSEYISRNSLYQLNNFVLIYCYCLARLVFIISMEPEKP